MRARPDQLAAQTSKGMAPVYLVSGDEPLQLNEACDTLRAAARKHGYADRQVFDIDASFDWNAFFMNTNSMSLFAERRLFELRLRSGKPGEKANTALLEYAARPAPDMVVLIIAPKLDKDAQNSKWFRAIDDAGTVVQVWPVETGQLPAWIERRMRAKGLQPTPEAVTLLAERVEGHLLAAAQEIDKLVLLYGSGAVDADNITAAVVDSARFDVYGLADAALAGDAARVARMLDGLRGEGEDPVLLLWALSREVRTLCAMAQDKKNGTPIPTLLAKHRVWDKRKPLFEKALNRHSALRWRHILRRCGTLDRIIKGREAGNAWDELLELGLVMSGVALFQDARRGSKAAANQ